MQHLHAFTHENTVFCTFWNKLRITVGNGTHLGEGNVLHSLEQYQQHAHRCFHNRVWILKDVKTSESETLDGQNIQTLHTLC